MIRLNEGKLDLVFTNGPDISDINDNLYPLAEMDKLLRSLLEELPEKYPNLFPPDIRNSLDIREIYRKYIDIVNIWNQVEHTNGITPNKPINKRKNITIILIF